PSTLMSSSRSGQCRPSPSPMSRQFARSARVPCASRGYQIRGTVIVRPSISSTTRAASVNDTFCACAWLMSIGDDEVLIPSPQKYLLVCDDEPFKMLELRSSESAAPSEADRVEPELRSLNVPLGVDVRRLIA